MPQAMPPQPERFEPVTARWLTPGGPLPDPELDTVDPDHRLPVELVGPVPPELAGATSPDADHERPRAGRIALALWMIVALLAAGGAGMILSTRVGYCPDPGECVVVSGGGPGGWVVVAVLVGLTVHAVRRALRR